MKECERLCGEPYVARSGGRKPPLMAEVGQLILNARIIGIEHFMEAKELRSQRICTSGTATAVLVI